MADMLKFPIEKTTLEAMYIHDLRGRKPAGHPPLKRHMLGRVVAIVGQVWVDNWNGYLWRIAEIDTYSLSGHMHREITLHSYGTNIDTIRMYERELRVQMTVWDDALMMHEGLDIEPEAELPTARIFTWPYVNRLMHKRRHT